ncbi:MAG: hypothetical protein VX278_12075, partial [Myxococcota bacterium]|nr:hypothetical protein [Myxococcota bacterium]
VSLVAGWADYKRVLTLVRTCALPIGISYTSIGFVRMIPHVSDPTAIGPLMSIGLLPCFYASILYATATMLMVEPPERPLASGLAAELMKNIVSFGPLVRSICAFGLYVVLVIVHATFDSVIMRHAIENLFPFIDVMAFTMVVVVSFLLSVLRVMINRKHTKSKMVLFLEAWRRSSIAMAALCSLAAYMKFIESSFLFFGYVGIGFCGILFASIIYVGCTASLNTGSIPNEPKPKEQIGLILLALLYGSIITGHWFLLGWTN